MDFFIRCRQIMALQPHPGKARLGFLVEEPATAEARRKAPPCGNPRCESPGDNVRLQFIPAGFAGEVRPGAICFHLKRADCRRHFLGGEPGKAGRPAKRGSETTRIPVGKALAVEPCPPIIDSIDEVWGYRCATAPASAILRLHSLTIFAARRLCDPAAMGPEDRSQPLQGAVIEYIVHGYFYWRETDTNGTHGAWWVPLRTMVNQLGQEYVEQKLEEFEMEMLRLKKDEIARAVAGESDDGGPAGHE